MSTHKICFCGERRNIFCGYPLLSGDMLFSKKNSALIGAVVSCFGVFMWGKKLTHIFPGVNTPSWKLQRCLSINTYFLSYWWKWVNLLEDLACPGKVWLSRLAGYDFNSVDWAVFQTNQPTLLSNCIYRIYPKYSDTSTPYHICSKIWTSTIHYPKLCLKIAGWVANSVDPDETPRSAASHLGLYCLLRPVCPNIYGKYGTLNTIITLILMHLHM